MGQRSVKELHSGLTLHSVRFAKDEQQRRKEQQVLFRWREVEKKLQEHRHIYVVDARIGSNNHTHRLWYDVIRPHTEEGRDWRTLGHRHTVEAIIYFLKGRGHSIIDGVRYDWGPGDLLCVPMFSWHRHINDGDEPVLRIASTTGPLSLALGQAVYEDERYPEFWVYAQEGEEARKTLIPGGSGQVEMARVGNNRAADLYAGDVAFAMREEEQRRRSKVLVKNGEYPFEPTAMGQVAYLVDRRIGFHTKALGVVIAEIPPGMRSGAHRHLYDEIDLVVSGSGKAIVEDKEYEFGALDVLSIPVFAWHQYFNTGSEPLRILAINTRQALENLGLALTHQGELADH